MLVVIIFNSLIYYFTAYEKSEKHCKILRVIFCFLYYVVRVHNNSLNIIFTVFIYSTVASWLFAKCSLHRIKHQNRFLTLYFNKYNNTIANIKKKSRIYSTANSMTNKLYHRFIVHCETASNKSV